MESKNLHENIEKAMQSLDGLQPAAPMPFFYTRLQARMEKENGVAEVSWLLLKKPIWLIATLICCLGLNALMITQLAKTNAQETSVNKQTTIESFATEFELNNSSNY